MLGQNILIYFSNVLNQFILIMFVCIFLNSDHGLLEISYQWLLGQGISCMCRMYRINISWIFLVVLACTLKLNLPTFQNELNFTVFD